MTKTSPPDCNPHWFTELEARITEIERRLDLLEGQFRGMSRHVLENTQGNPLAKLRELKTAITDLQDIMDTMPEKEDG